MSTQACPLSFVDQAFQNQKKKTKWQETFEKMEASCLGSSSSQQLNHTIIAQASECGSPIHWRRCYEYI